VKPPCSQPDCGKPAATRGLCGMHYRRWQRHGDVNANLKYNRDPIQRFWSKVNQNGACWLWTGKDNGHDYGVFVMGRRSLGQRREFYAHRFAYELLHGPIPAGLQVDHLCRVRRCVNPAHMELVTSAENTRRAGLAVTQCRHGHPYTPENTYRVPGTGRRSCYECRRLRAAGIDPAMAGAS
jgi:hypothetical protein